MKVYFEMSRGGRAHDRTLEFPNEDAYFRHLDILQKHNEKDPYKRRQFWWARDAQTMTILAEWSPKERTWKTNRKAGSESALW